MNKLSIPTVKENASKLHTSVYEFCRQRFPLYTIIQEYPIEVVDRGKKVTLFFDLYIKELNLFIECNGEQHYKPNGFFFGGSFGFKNAQKNDNLKRQWCNDNKSKLVIFKFNDILNYEFFNKVINEALLEE